MCIPKLYYKQYIFLWNVLRDKNRKNKHFSKGSLNDFFLNVCSKDLDFMKFEVMFWKVRFDLEGGIFWIPKTRSDICTFILIAAILSWPNILVLGLVKQDPCTILPCRNNPTKMTFNQNNLIPK